MIVLLKTPKKVSNILGEFIMNNLNASVYWYVWTNEPSSQQQYFILNFII